MTAHIGFTGTRSGMTLQQHIRLVKLLHKTHMTHVHHGGAIGADEQFHFIVRRLDPRIHITVHPASISQNDAQYYKGSNVTVLPAKPPLARNRDIVAAVDFLIACPAQSKEIVRSGTWATYRYAKAAGIRTRCLLP